MRPTALIECLRRRLFAISNKDNKHQRAVDVMWFEHLSNKEMEQLRLELQRGPKKWTAKNIIEGRQLDGVHPDISPDQLTAVQLKLFNNKFHRDPYDCPWNVFPPGTVLDRRTLAERLASHIVSCSKQCFEESN